MIHSGDFTALLDANVLYPAPLRDFLLRLADLDLYKAKWTEQIQTEWLENLLLTRKDLSKEKLEKTKEAMNSAFPDADVSNYEDLIPGLILNDMDDRHVLAAAIKAKASVIVTCNLKHFPVEYLQKFDLEPQHPDSFVANLIELDKMKVIEALNNQVKSLKRPPQTKSEVLQTLQKCGLAKSVILLEQ